MIVIRNKLIPFRGFTALAFYPILFIRKEAELSDRTIRHEKIHHQQQIELLLVGFYFWYAVEYVIRLLIWLDRLNWQEIRVASDLAYHDISFEREAYENEDDPDYLKSRKVFSYTDYIQASRNS